MANQVNVSTTTNTVTITPQNTTNVSVEATNTSVNVTQGSTSVVQVTTQGPKGDTGATGATGPQGPQGPVQNTGSLLTTASYSNPNLTFTKGDGTEFSVEIEAGSTDTGSLLTTASVSLNTLTFTKGDSSTFNITVDTGSAETVDTGSLLTTASITDATVTFTKGDASTFNIEIDNVTSSISASYILADNVVQPFTSLTASAVSASGDLTSNTLTAAGITYPITDGNNGDVLITDGAGTLSFTRTTVYANVKNVHGSELVKGTPVHVTGATGNTSEVIAASASNAVTMPAHFILNETLANETEGLAIAIGYINGVNTFGFSEGDTVYVGANGGYTNVKPTGSNLIQNLGIVDKIHASNGSGFVLGAGRSNDVPNISPGYVWVGNSDSVATAVPTSSFKQYTDSFTMGFDSTSDGITTFGLYPLSHYNESASKADAKFGIISSSNWLSRVIPCEDLNSASKINIHIAGTLKIGTVNVNNQVRFSLYSASLGGTISEPLDFSPPIHGSSISLTSDTIHYVTQSFTDLSLGSDDVILVGITQVNNTTNVTAAKPRVQVRLSREYTK